MQLVAGSALVFRGDLPHRHANYAHESSVIHMDIHFSGVLGNENGGAYTISSHIPLPDKYEVHDVASPPQLTDMLNFPPADVIRI